jgi:hypothetical protein
VDLPRLVLITGAAARLTRLTTRDAITEGPRTKIHRLVLFSPEQRAALKSGKPVPPPRSQSAAKIRTKIHEGLSCDWCVGVWWTALVTAAHYVTGAATGRRRTGATLVEAACAALAGAHVLGWLSEHESPEPVVVHDDHRHGTENEEP